MASRAVCGIEEIFAAPDLISVRGSVCIDR
jgi:hypothetical protein